MRGVVAKRLRKEAKFEKIVIPKVVGDFNININSGASSQVLNIKKTEPTEWTQDTKDAKIRYKILKKQYKK